MLLISDDDKQFLCAIHLKVKYISTYMYKGVAYLYWERELRIEHGDEDITMFNGRSDSQFRRDRIHSSDQY